MRIAHASRLLAAARSLDGLRPLAHAAGFTAPLDPLPRDARRALALPDWLRHPRVGRASGPLRALVATVDTSLPLRDAAARLAATLAARTPELLWLLLLVHADGDAVALATWTPSPGARPPRLAALHCHPADVRDSDAETLAALAAHAPDPASPDPAAPLLAYARWTDVLGRESLGRRFYATLARTVAALADSATPTLPDPASRRELALLHTSRLLFLGFLEARGWLDGDRAFLTHHFDRCMAAGGGFHRRTLLPLFFGTLNTPRRRRAPAAHAFGRIPFLNGGLFAPTRLERRHRALRFSDDAFGELVHDLLARHRFTAREDSTSGSEAAVDPEMLGRAFESLMHEQARHASGAFFTPPALVEHATTEALRAALLRDPATRPVVEPALAGTPLPHGPAADALRARLAAVRLLDPACGSGAFLVHALERLATLQQLAGDPLPTADLRRLTLARSIFGVDVNPTAVWLCELRLWLSVVIESEVDDPTRVPPLPNLDHNVRVGDALATPPGLDLLARQGWGGAPWGEPTAGPATVLPSAARTTACTTACTTARGAARTAARLGDLRARYARLAGPRKLAAARRLDAGERQAALATLDRALARLRHARAERLAQARARDLFGHRHPPSAVDRAALLHLRQATRALAARRRAVAAGAALPFGFPWHFPDAAAAGGFDLLVGNPPWVRPHAVPAADRIALRATYASARHAAWAAGAALAGAGLGFAAQVDLAALFTERALALARPGGTVAFLVPAKLWRALAGGGLRRLLAHEATVALLEDWSDAPAAFDAVTYPALLVATRRAGPPADAPPSTVPAAPAAPAVTTLRVHRGRTRWESTAPTSALSLDGTPDAPWLLLPADVRAAFDRLRAAGTPLARTALTRPTLGVKCGCNEAFLVHATPGDDALAQVHHGPRTALVERALLRPVLRGEHLATPEAPTAPDAPREMLLWPHDALGRPIPTLPPHAERWLLPLRPRLAARTDARDRAPWWSLFRTAAADVRRPRVVWADLARAPHPRFLPAGDPHVPLNTCYSAAFDEELDARAFATLLAAPLTAAWLGALAEPARGGYRRHLAWTVALLPLPHRWATARHALAHATSDAPPATLTQLVAEAYDLPLDALAPLLAWDAHPRAAPPPASMPPVPPHSRALATVRERRPAWGTRARHPDVPPR